MSLNTIGIINILDIKFGQSALVPNEIELSAMALLSLNVLWAFYISASRIGCFPQSMLELIEPDFVREPIVLSLPTEISSITYRFRSEML